MDKEKALKYFKYEMEALQEKYNYLLDNYEEDGEEDFNMFLKMFMEKESEE